MQAEIAEINVESNLNENFKILKFRKADLYWQKKAKISFDFRH